ncbi:cytochrome o ubiquinol oxidase subunit III [Parachlamydia sp. AcF125]|uniref:cytochrome o ubiquinol oxidase subunit III n=1 Tax=Parachlamydia sp. AcF125 TaxID=2795736 RepID=UPI001BCA51B3|nr:cytochrome o ubiquinol oxidase subunit III [Parachlamydia sp. AcF125]MBS4167820.1 Cytochrome bo(3) ubiquinol oxidase subunit 3 [Parachlamydia sp. AcF125]
MIKSLFHSSGHEYETYSRTVLGFWIYLMTDCVLFISLFTTYAVLHNSTFGGPSGRELFSLSTAFGETLILLVSSVTCGFAMLSSLKNKKNAVIGWLAITFLLGAAFIGLELEEFATLIQEGNSWQKSAFLSSFFTLVGTHGLHVSIGLLWMSVVIFQLYFYDITPTTFRRLVIFSMYWHFLDLVWIFIFTFVYLIGVI